MRARLLLTSGFTVLLAGRDRSDQARTGELVNVIAGTAAPPGAQTDCLAGAVATCYHATWGISAGNGEKIRPGAANAAP